MTRKFAAISTFAFVIGTLNFAQQASAQETANSAPGSSTQQEQEAAEIIVAAHFRLQTLQDTPVAITAINAAGLDVRSATQVAEISNVAPSVLVRPAAAAFAPAVSVFIRSVGQ